jgi:predicted RNA-binding Zn-ribbon protein involved in translation (DUF1610 family)
MQDRLAALAGYFRIKSRLPDQDLVRLTGAARAAGSRWDAIAAACGVRTYEDLAGVVYQITGESGADLLFSATQYAAEQLTGSQRRYPLLTWTCPECGRLVTDRAASGRPIHVKHGHAPGCARLARDQADDNERRRQQIPRLILNSEPPVGPVQRHWLRQRITDDCPRCGWRGYFHHYLATIDGDLAAAVCDDFPINFACYRRWRCDTRGECWASFGRCIGSLMRWRFRRVGTRFSTNGVTSSSVKMRTDSSQATRSWWTRSIGWTFG